MSEDEAETVLLVLGRQLQWQHIKLSDQEQGFAEGKCLYIVSPVEEAGRSGFSIDWRTPLYARWKTVRLPKTRERMLHATLTAAKAACERHHATGKWEG